MFSFQALVSVLLLSSLVCTSPVRHGANVNGLGVPVSNAAASNIIPNRYIVVYNNNATDEAVKLHQASVMTTMRKRGLGFSSKMSTFSMAGWRGMSMEAEDDGLMIDISNADEVSKTGSFRVYC